MGFENIPSNIKQEISDYKTRLRSGPTEYFEAKPGRAVDFFRLSKARLFQLIRLNPPLMR